VSVVYSLFIMRILEIRTSNRMSVSQGLNAAFHHRGSKAYGGALRELSLDFSSEDAMRKDVGLRMNACNLVEAVSEGGLAAEAGMEPHEITKHASAEAAAAAASFSQQEQQEQEQEQDGSSSNAAIAIGAANFRYALLAVDGVVVTGADGVMDLVVKAKERAAKCELTFLDFRRAASSLPPPPPQSQNEAEGAGGGNSSGGSGEDGMLMSLTFQLSSPLGISIDAETSAVNSVVSGSQSDGRGIPVGRVKVAAVDGNLTRNFSGVMEAINAAKVRI
jgi:hypothetical protein